MRAFVVVFSALFVSLAGFSSAAPIETRQIGNLACNVARLGVVTGLASASKAVNTLSSATAGTPDSEAVSTAKTAIQSAQTAVAGIGAALITGQTASADLRNQTAQGITDATTALQGLNNTDPSVQTALDALGRAASNGEKVLSECK